MGWPLGDYEGLLTGSPSLLPRPPVTHPQSHVGTRITSIDVRTAPQKLVNEASQDTAGLPESVREPS